MGAETAQHLLRCCKDQTCYLLSRSTCTYAHTYIHIHTPGRAETRIYQWL